MHAIYIFKIIFLHNLLKNGLILLQKVDKFEIKPSLCVREIYKEYIKNKVIKNETEC